MAGQDCAGTAPPPFCTGRSIERIVTTPTQSLARPLGLPLIEVEARMTRKLEEAGHDVSEILEDLEDEPKLRH